MILPYARQSGGVDVSMAFIALPLFFTLGFLHTVWDNRCAEVCGHFSKLAEMRCPGPGPVSKIRRRFVRAFPSSSVVQIFETAPKWGGSRKGRNFSRPLNRKISSFSVYNSISTKKERLESLSLKEGGQGRGDGAHFHKQSTDAHGRSAGGHLHRARAGVRRKI